MRYYGTDLSAVIAGNGPHPLLVLSQVQGLPGDSLTAALMRGGREHYGWDQQTHLLAEIVDMLGLVARAAGNWAKKPPEIPPYPRPTKTSSRARSLRSANQNESAPPRRKVSVRELWGKINKGGMSAR